MADNKEELGTDLDKMEDFDFDFDSDFGGDFFAEEPPPANKREAVSRSLKAAGRGFAEEFDVRDPEKIEKFIGAAIPSSLSTEYNSLIDLKESVIKELEKTGPEIKRNTNKLLKTINKYMPKGKISSGVEKLIGITESEQAYSKFGNQASKEAMLEESIAKMLEATMARDERDNAEARIKEEIAYRKDLNHLEISNHIVANLDRLINFEHSVTTNYYKKSLDLQFRLLDSVSQTLELHKLAADTNKNQLESIIRNTSLPDVVKVRSAEVVKMLALQNTANSAMKNLFGEGTRADRIKKRLFGIAKDKIGSFSSNLQGANMGIDMAESMKEQADSMGQSNMGSNMVGSSIGGAARDMLGDITGRYLEKNKKTANRVADIKEFFSDPRSWFKEKLDDSYSKNKDPNFLERKKRDFLSLMAEATNSSLRDGYISVDRVDLDASAIYTNRTNDAITKTIPKLLSEILYNTTGTNLTLQQYTGITPTVDKLRLDATTGKLISEKASILKLEKRFESEARSGGGAYNIRRATGTFLEDGKMKLSESERAELDRAVSEYIMEGGQVTSKMFDDKKLLSKLKDKKLIKRVFRANEDFKTRGTKLDRSKAKTDFNNYIDNTLTSIKSPDQLFSKMIREGNIDQLEELGLIKITEDGTPIVDNKRYKELISGAFYKESLKYAEQDNYKNQWDTKAELEKLAKAKAKERVDNLKNKATEVKDNVVDKANKFKSDLSDGTIERKIEEALSKENLKSKASMLSDKASNFKVRTIDEATKKIDILKAEIDNILLTDENLEKVNEAKAKLSEARDVIVNSNVSKQIANSVESFKAEEVIDKANVFTNSLINNIKGHSNIAAAKTDKESLIEEKLENLVEAIDKNTTITEESNKISKEDIKVKSKFNDVNNDGVRDGSFREKLSGAFRTGPKEVEKKKEEKKEDKSSGIFKMIMGGLFGGFTSLVGGIFSGFSGLFGGLTSLIGGIGTKIIGPLLGGLASMVPGFIKGGAKLAGGLLGGGAKATKNFVKATSKTRGFEQKLFGGILKKVGGAALRKLPLIGLLAGGYMGYDMIKGGDMIGGLGTMVSSLLAQIPGVGTALSLGVDSLLMLDRDKKTNDLDIEVELEKKKQELEERNAMMQKANENNWEKEAIMLQNKFDKYTAEQDLIKNKINELENGKFKTASKEKLLDKEREKLSKSEKELAEAKALQSKLDIGSEALKNMKEKRDKFLDLSKDDKFPEQARVNFKLEADKIDAQIVTQENKNNEMKKLIDSQNKADNVVNSVGDPKKRLEVAIKTREKLLEHMRNAKDPNAALAMSKAVANQDLIISKLNQELTDSSVTEETNALLNKDNKRYEIEQDIKRNPELYTREDSHGDPNTLMSPDEEEANRRKKLLEDRILELEERKIRVNEEAKKKNANMSGYGTGVSQYSSGLGSKSFGNNYYMAGGKSGGMSTYDSGDISIADEITIAKNSYKGGDVKKIIDSASSKAGIDNTLMQVMAAKESGFRTDVKAPTSSALGLYQFLNGTWKDVIQNHGNKYDLSLSNASRLDPTHSTLMAAEYLKSNLKHIKGVKPNPNITDAYLTHFLGPGGARKLLSADPDQSAESVVGKAAVNANPGIFIGNGRIRTVRETYDTVAKQLAKTAGQFGIKIDKEDVGGSSGVSIIKPGGVVDPAKELSSTNTTGPDTPSTPRANNELANMSGITSGHNANTPVNSNSSNVTPPSSNEQITPTDIKQAVYNNGADKMAKDSKDRENKIAEAQNELNKRQANYNAPQGQINNMDPNSNINDSSFKTLLISTNSLAKATTDSVAKLDTIAKNTGDTVAVLQKIHDKLDNLGNLNGQQAKANNQSSNLVTTALENAISGKRGRSVN